MEKSCWPTSDIKLSQGLTLTEDTSAVAELFNNFFTNVDSEASRPTEYRVPKKSKREISLDLDATTESEINLLKPLKRGGWSQTPAAYYKCLSHTIILALTIIVNNSLKQSTFPSLYKQALITPIFKKGDNQLPQNYRPTSSLPVLSKIIESIVNGQVTKGQ